MISEKDIMSALEAYVRSPEGRAWLKDHHNVAVGSLDKIAHDIRAELILAIRKVLPKFRFDLIRIVKDPSSRVGEQYFIEIDGDALRRESLYYETGDGGRASGDGVNDILALFTHGYTLKHRPPYGRWDRSDGSSVMTLARRHRDEDPFLSNLCQELNDKYAGTCVVSLHEDYQIKIRR